MNTLKFHHKGCSFYHVHPYCLKAEILFVMHHEKTILLYSYICKCFNTLLLPDICSLPELVWIIKLMSDCFFLNIRGHPWYIVPHPLYRKHRHQVHPGSDPRRLPHQHEPQGAVLHPALRQRGLWALPQALHGAGAEEGQAVRLQLRPDGHHLRGGVPEGGRADGRQ